MLEYITLPSRRLGSSCSLFLSLQVTFWALSSVLSYSLSPLFLAGPKYHFLPMRLDISVHFLISNTILFIYRYSTWFKNINIYSSFGEYLIFVYGHTNLNVPGPIFEAKQDQAWLAHGWKTTSPFIIQKTPNNLLYLSKN